MESEDLNSNADPKQALNDHDEQILSEYYNLTSRRVDLVGDYAGSELFLVDGDSLLLQCFSNETLDFGNGFQLLHAVFLVEQFLHGLRLRKCTFNIVFFHASRGLCIPAKADKLDAPKYLFARAAIIRHLSSSFPHSCPELSLHVFESWTSTTFHRYLQQSRPYFVMMHDGSQKSQYIDKGRLALRRIIIHFIASGYNIALINELQWQDTKIMVSVLEPRKRLNLAPMSDETSESAYNISKNSLVSRVEHIRTVITNPSERQILAVLAVSSMLQNCPPDAPLSQWTEMCVSFLLHQALITHLPLSARRFSEIIATEEEKHFLQSIASVSETLVNDSLWAEKMSSISVASHIADYVDGRLFFQVARSHPQPSVDVHETFLQSRNAVNILLGTDMPLHLHGKMKPTARQHSDGDPVNATDLVILPFSNPVFDKHLEIVRIAVDNTHVKSNDMAGQKIFKEVSHWHNARRPLIRKGAPVAVNPWQVKKAAIRNQRFMAEMQKYAASLTNAVGKSLEPETIVSGQVPSSGTTPRNSTPAPKTEPLSTGSGPKKPVAAKDSIKNKRKTDLAHKIAADQAKKASAIEEKSLNAWRSRREEIDKLPKLEMRYLAAQRYFFNLSPDRDAACIQCELYMVNCLVSYMYHVHEPKIMPTTLNLAAIVWHHLWQIGQRQQLPESSAKYMTDLVDRLNLPRLPAVRTISTPKELTFSSTSLLIKQPIVQSSHQEFLLQHCGPYLERSFDSKPDKRVGFPPVAWQRRVLDSIDSNESAFVIAPTSAGKTFISFYAM